MDKMLKFFAAKQNGTPDTRRGPWTKLMTLHNVELCCLQVSSSRVHSC